MSLIFRMLWPELRVHWKRLIWVFVFGLLVSAAKSATPPLIQRLADVWTVGDHVKAWEIPALIGVLWMTASFLNYFHMYWMLSISEDIAVNLRRILMNKYLDLNLSFFNKFLRGAAGLMSRMLNDINVIQSGFQKIADIIREPFTAIFSFAYLLYIDWRLTGFLLIAIPCITLVLRTFAKSVRKYSRRNQESMEDLTQVLKESLDGTRVVQSFNLQDEMRRRFENQADDFLRSKKKMISRDEASGSISEALAALFIAVILFYIGQRAIHKQFSSGDFFGFLGAIVLLQDSVRKLQESYIKLQQSAVALDRMKTILDSTSIVPETPEPQPFPNKWDEIVFENVSFAYEKNGVLKDVNLRIRRGEHVALVGSSGAGKSTLINLLPRFFDPTDGDIKIGGISIKDMSLADLRDHIALVTQDVFLFSDTVERNIWSGDFSKASDNVVPAARLANADSFIRSSEEGYMARVGDRGSLFSGGEKQRISIARAIFKDAPILILDEATSALDSESEQEVQKGLEHLLQGRTALIIAHRLSTISSCDRIIVLDKGQILEEGTHESLMEEKGAYFRFCQLQSRL